MQPNNHKASQELSRKRHKTSQDSSQKQTAERQPRLSTTTYSTESLGMVKPDILSPEKVSSSTLDGRRLGVQGGGNQDDCPNQDQYLPNKLDKIVEDSNSDLEHSSRGGRSKYSLRQSRKHLRNENSLLGSIQASSSQSKNDSSSLANVTASVNADNQYLSQSSQKQALYDENFSQMAASKHSLRDQRDKSRRMSQGPPSSIENASSSNERQKKPPMMQVEPNSSTSRSNVTKSPTNQTSTQAAGFREEKIGTTGRINSQQQTRMEQLKIVQSDVSRSKTKPKNKKLRNLGTMQYDQSHPQSRQSSLVGPGQGRDSLKKVSSTTKRNKSSSSQRTKSVSHAISPVVFNNDSSRVSSNQQYEQESARFQSENNNLTPQEKLKQQILRSLDQRVEQVDKKAQLSHMLSCQDESMEGDIENVSESNAPKIRNYLERNFEYRQRNESKVYSDQELKEFVLIKPILSRRTQFNENKKDFHNQLLKKFPLTEQSQMNLQNKESNSIKDKTKKRGDLNLAQHHSQGSNGNKKNQPNCIKRLETAYEENMLLIKDEVSFRVHGKQHVFSKNALGFLDNKSRFRIMIVWIITWPVFDKLVLFLITLNSLGLGSKDYVVEDSPRNKFIDSFDVYFNTAFLIECILKILGMGFFIGKGAYLKDPWNWLDFIVVVSSMLEKYLSSMSGLRVFRLFRPLRSLNNVKSMQILVETLFKSMMSLGGIMGLAIFFFTIFAILGISQWRGLTHYRCRVTEFPEDGDWIAIPEDTELCQIGQRECKVGWCGSLIQRNDTYGDLYAVDNLYRDSEILELNYGVTNFDNLGSAFLTIFQCITMEGWTIVMYIFQDVAAPFFVVIYFMTCVVICSFFLLNLTIAVMLMEYDELEQKNDKSVHKKELREIGATANLPPRLIVFIIAQSSLTIGKKAKQKLKEVTQKELTLCQKLVQTEYIQKEDRNSYYAYSVPRFFYAAAKSNIFGSLIMICIIMNTIVLSLDRFPESNQEEQDFLAIFNFIFNVVFSMEVIVKMVGLGLTRYIKNFENIFDFIVVAMSWFELGMGSEGGSSLGALRAVRLFRVFKLFKSGDLRILMDSIVFTVSTIGPYTVLLCLFLYVFALMGMQFFAGNFLFLDQGVGRFDPENGEPPRANFDTLPQALLTTFACFIGDNWTTVMYDAMRSSGSFFALYYVCVIAFGNIVMLNLFLAILLGNFDRARDFGGKKKLLNCFMELEANGLDLSQCIDYILEDTSEYIKKSILKWDMRMVRIEEKQPSPFLRSMLCQNVQFMETMDLDLKHNYEPPVSSDESDDIDRESEKSDPRQKRKKQLALGSAKNRKKFLGESEREKVDTQKKRVTISTLENQKTLNQESEYSIQDQQKPQIGVKTLDSKSDLNSQKKSKKIAKLNGEDNAILELDTSREESSIKSQKLMNKSLDQDCNKLDPFEDSQQVPMIQRQSYEAKEIRKIVNATNETAKKGKILLGRAQTEILPQADSNYDTNRQLQTLAVATKLAIIADENKMEEFGDTQRQLINTPSKSQKFPHSASTPLSPRSQIPFSRIITTKKAKPSFMLSIKSMLSSKKKKLDLQDQEQAEVIKELMPNSQTLKRSGESKNLKETIKKSKEYIVVDPQYYLHSGDFELQVNDQFQNSSRACHQLSPSQILSQSPDKMSAGQSQMSPQHIKLTPAKIQMPASPAASNAVERFKSRSNSPSNLEKKKVSGSRKFSPAKLLMSMRKKSKSNGQLAENDFHQIMPFSLDKDLEEFRNPPKINFCQKICNQQCWYKVGKHMKESSLLIFHKDSKIRKFCLKFLVTEPKIKLKGELDETINDMKLTDSKLKNVSAMNSDKITRNSSTVKHSKLQNNDSNKNSSSRNSSRNLKRRKSIKSKREKKSFAGELKKLDSNLKIGSKYSRCLFRCCPSLYQTTPQKFFDNTILCLIFTSSVMLALDNPLNDPNSDESTVYGIIDKIHTFLFTIEMMVKMIGLGFFTNSLKNSQVKPYIRSTWNALDFFVVMSSIAELVMPLLTGGGGADSLKSLKALRALRALRPLRMVSKNEGMKLVVGALMTSIPSMTNVLLVCMLLLLIMAIVGVNLFKGQFFSCQGLTYFETLEIEDKLDCIASGGSWENQDINFDNVMNAMMSLFSMMTTEGWLSVMYNGMDATGVDKQPKKNTQPIMAIYFVAFMIIGSQFIINLFVGVVIDNFNKIKEKDEMGNNFVTQEQRAWIEIQKVCLRKNLVKEMSRPKGYQKFFNKITENSWFDNIITGCIILNTIAMAVVHYRQSATLTETLNIMNYIFAFVFNVEMILKLLAYGRNYFRQGWNVFDCLIVFGTNFGLVLKFANAGASFGSTTSIIRGFRIMRIFRLAKASIAIRLLIDTIMNILPQVTNIMMLMGILLFIYAALGLNLFSQVMFQEEINEKNNFRNFGNAMILLMRCATGEDWHLIMYELANTSGYGGVQCIEQDYTQQIEEGILGCGSPISFFYFFSFVILITMLIINLSVAAVIQGLDAACQENLGIVSSDDVDNFIDLWKYYDPEAKGWIGAENLVYLLIELGAPLGRKKGDGLPMNDDNGNEDYAGYSADRYLVQKDKKIVIKKVKALVMLQDNLKLKMHKDVSYQGGYKVHYQEVLRGLLKRILTEKKQDFKIKGEIEAKIATMWTKKHKSLKSQSKHKIKLTAGDLAAVRIIENWFLKKRQITRSKPEAKKVDGDKIDQFKEAEKQLSKARQENSEFYKPTVDASQENQKQTKQPAEAAKKNAAQDYQELMEIQGGQEILHNIEKASKKNQNQKMLEGISPRIKDMKSGNFKLNTQQPQNLTSNNSLTWHKETKHGRLVQEVEREEACRKRLREQMQLSEESEDKLDQSSSQETQANKNSLTNNLTGEEAHFENIEIRPRANSEEGINAAASLDINSGSDQMPQHSIFAKNDDLTVNHPKMAKINNFSLQKEDQVEGQQSKNMLPVNKLSSSSSNSASRSGKKMGEGLFSTTKKNQNQESSPGQDPKAIAKSQIRLSGAGQFNHHPQTNSSFDGSETHNQ